MQPIEQPTKSEEEYGKDKITEVIQGIADKFLETLQDVKKASIEVYTISEVAEILKCKVNTVKHHLQKKRDLRYLIVGREVRVRSEDLKEFLENHLTPCVHDQEILP
ncbi:MAG: helix-turn-helix domain-containing protein [Proteobacteria bacterium]|nr:helix-turn-helix domain-containing protein [Pseudomonadota bacterium]